MKKNKNALVVILGLLLFGVFGSGCTDSLLTIEGGVTENPASAGMAQRVHPGIKITAPDQGYFATSGEVTLRGEVTEGTGPLRRLTINGEEVALAGDRFEIEMPLRAGPNIFGLRLEAEDGGRAVDAITVYGPGVHPPGSALTESLSIRLGQGFLDNNTPQLDDLAGILEALLKDDRFLESFFSEPYHVSGETTLRVERVKISDARIDLLAIPGCLETKITLGEVAGRGQGFVEIDIQTTGAGAVLGDIVLLTARRIDLEALICPEGTGGDLFLDIYEPEVQFQDFLLATNRYPDLGESFPTINNLIASMAESALESWIGNSMADLVLELLEGFVGSYSFGTAPEVRANFSIETVRVDGKGLTIGVSGGFESLPGLPGLSPHAGSLATEGAALGVNFSDAPVALAMSDDLLNQFLFAFWYGGGVAEFELPTDELDALPEVFQPVTGLDVALHLPPTFVAPTYPEEYGFDMAVGGIAVTLESGDRVFEIDLHLQAGVGLRLDEEGELELLLDNRAQRINVQAGVSRAPERHDRGDLAALIRLMVPPVLGGVGVSYGGFPIPSFRLSDFAESLAGFEDREVTFSPSNIRIAGDGGGYVVVEGRVREVELSLD